MSALSDIPWPSGHHLDPPPLQCHATIVDHRMQVENEETDNLTDSFATMDDAKDTEEEHLPTNIDTGLRTWGMTNDSSRLMSFHLPVMRLSM